MLGLGGAKKKAEMLKKYSFFTHFWRVKEAAKNLEPAAAERAGPLAGGRGRETLPELVFKGLEGLLTSWCLYTLRGTRPRRIRILRLFSKIVLGCRVPRSVLGPRVPQSNANQIKAKHVNIGLEAYGTLIPTSNKKHPLIKKYENLGAGHTCTKCFLGPEPP